MTLVKDGGEIIICDPGVAESQDKIVAALAKEGLTPDDITIVFLTHSHIDHYRNIGMFTKAKTLEYFGLWSCDTVVDWEEQFTPNIKIIKTPGHSRDALSLLVQTGQGKIAIAGDVFWKENFPDNDPYASDLLMLKQSRESILKLADFIIPGHGPMFQAKKN